MAIDIGDIPTGTPPTAGEKLQIRSAIGVGTTDAPTFLAQTLTGQSLTGVQATSLVNMAATWNTTGNPSLIYGRVTNTNSGTTANLIDLGTFAGGSLFKVTKTGDLFSAANLVSGTSLGTGVLGGNYAFYAGDIGGGNKAVSIINGWSYAFSSGSQAVSNQDIYLTRAAAGILAQRNGDAAQAFRLYNFYNTAGANYERGEFVWSGNTLFIQAIGAGTGVAQPLSFGGASINFRTSIGAGYVARWNFSTTGHFLAATDNTYDIGASGANRPRNLYAGTSVIAATSVSAGGAILSPLAIYTTNGGVISLGGDFSMKSPSGSSTVCFSNNALNDFNRLQLGGTTDVFPAIARDGAGIKITGASAGLTSWIKVPAVAVASLPLAATAGVGARAFVNNALNPVFGNAVAGFGLSVVPVYSDGTNWNVG